ncbi:MAG: type II secretion system protein GspM [Rhodopila sp.]
MAVALALAALVWSVMISPALSWYSERNDMLQRQEVMARRMAALVQTLPLLRRAAEEADRESQTQAHLLPGGFSALAAASLQQQLNERATAAGVTMSSQEILPPQADGSLSQIAVRAAVSAPCRNLIGFLQALAEPEIPLVVTELQIRGIPMTMMRGPDAIESLHAEDIPIECTLTIMSFREQQVRRMNSGRPQHGFTLLETLIAFAITAAALAVLFRGGIESLAAGATAARILEASSRAQSRLAVACSGADLRAGSQSGDDGSGFTWHTQVTRIATHLIRAEGEEAAPVARADLLSVSVTISWPGPRAGHNVTLVTECVTTSPHDRF